MKLPAEISSEEAVAQSHALAEKIDELLVGTPNAIVGAALAQAIARSIYSFEDTTLSPLELWKCRADIMTEQAELIRNLLLRWDQEPPTTRH